MQKTPVGDEATLFAQHHQHLLRSVARVVNTDGPTVEEACSFAWLQLMRTNPVRGETLFAWLRTVAVREAIRLDRRFRLTNLLSEEALEYAVGTAIEMDDELEARQALKAVADLPPRQRRALGLQAAGYSYDEIAELTGDTHRTVERQVMRARRTLCPTSPPG